MSKVERIRLQQEQEREPSVPDPDEIRKIIPDEFEPAPSHEIDESPGEIDNPPPDWDIEKAP